MNKLTELYNAAMKKQSELKKALLLSIEALKTCNESMKPQNFLPKSDMTIDQIIKKLESSTLLSAQPCKHRNPMIQYTGAGAEVQFCPNCGKNSTNDFSDPYPTIVSYASELASKFIVEHPKTLKGFGVYPIFEKDGKFGFWDEVGLIGAEGFESEVEAAYELGKYCQQLNSQSEQPNSAAVEPYAYEYWFKDPDSDDIVKILTRNVNAIAGYKNSHKPLYLHPPTKPQRITEQDAREIACEFIPFWDGDSESIMPFASFDSWCQTTEFKTLLAKLNENREPDYKGMFSKFVDDIENYEQESEFDFLIKKARLAIAKH